MVNELWLKMLKDHDDWWREENNPLKSYMKKLNNGTATSREARKYAEINADKWSEILQKYIGVDVQGEWADEEIQDAIRRVYELSYKQCTYFEGEVIKRINNDAGVTLGAAAVVVDDRIDNLINKMAIEAGADISGQFVTAKNEWLLSKHVSESIATAGVTDTIKASAEKAKKAGLAVYMVRKLDPSGCCKWCQSMAGTYDKGDEPRDFWRFHHDCGCWIDYHTSKRAFTRVSYETYIDENGNKRLSKIEQ